ncbi:MULTISPECIES: HNH endonuclease [unclassified Paenibacillus]|uniref:HNH endonuclease n=1 Tax=unclassified Paenibacillus TaxID=185978 RepID=UPI00092FFF5E|nr:MULTISPECIES: HNH endonuclease signature motif containing protein [unclassified Paenibacillus]
MKKTVDPFYKSAAWLKCREAVLIRDHYLCQPCLRKQKITCAYAVHHIQSLHDRPDLALTMDNLESICAACHNKEHPEKAAGKRKEHLLKRRATILKSKANEERW